MASLFTVLGNRISSVYLIGQYLAIPFLNTASYLIQVGSDIRNVANSWDDVLDIINAKLSQINVLGDLRYYANKLIAFIQNPTLVIFQSIRTLYPDLDRLFDNLYGYLHPIILSIVREVSGTLEEIRNYVNEKIFAAIPGFNLFRFDPVEWVIEKIRQYSGTFSQFLQDPDGFIVERIRIYFPDLWLFFQDPRDFIIDKVVEGFETLSERYLARVHKIIENIISQLF